MSGARPGVGVKRSGRRTSYGVEAKYTSRAKGGDMESTRTECARPTDAEIRDVLDQVVQFLGNLQAGPEAFGGPATLCDFSLWLRTMESHGERVKERVGLLAERMNAERSEAPVDDQVAIAAIQNLVGQLRRRFPPQEGDSIGRYTVEISAAHQLGFCTPEIRISRFTGSEDQKVQHAGYGSTFESAVESAQPCICKKCGQPCDGTDHPQCGEVP
jgi:hypothetical protein